MRDITVPWSYLLKAPELPVVVPVRKIIESALLLVIMLVPLLVPLLSPSIFLRVAGAGLLLSAPFSVPFMVLAVTGKGSPSVYRPTHLTYR